MGKTVNLKLYYNPLARSLADHIAFSESGARFDIKTKRTGSEAEFNEIMPKGYVAVLVLDSGEVLTENVAILDWLATQFRRWGSPALWAARVCLKRLPSFRRKCIRASSRCGIAAATLRGSGRARGFQTCSAICRAALRTAICSGRRPASAAARMI